ncbi:MAG: hypothetical protein ACREJN_08315 [Nitrospiraceae bacterium]
MKIHDKAGRPVEEGDVVEIYMAGMFRAHVRKIVEAPVITTGQPQLPPHAVLDIQIMAVVNPDLGLGDVYLIGTPDKKLISPDGGGVN